MATPKFIFIDEKIRPWSNSNMLALIHYWKPGRFLYGGRNGPDRDDLERDTFMSDFDNPPKVTWQYVDRINQIELVE